MKRRTSKMNIYIKVDNDKYIIIGPSTENSVCRLAKPYTSILKNVTGIKQENTTCIRPSNHDKLHARTRKIREQNQTKTKPENVMHIVGITKDDNILYCEDCKQEHEEDCPVHGPLIVVQNMKVEENDPDRALHSLPPNLLVKESDIKGAGLGVFTNTEILRGTTFGPYEGMYISDPELANASSYCWQIHKDGSGSHFIDAEDTARSNWMRYVNCAMSLFDQNLVAFQYKGAIYYRCIKPILPKTELLVWYGYVCARKFSLKKDKNTVDLMPSLPNVEARSVENLDEKMDIPIVNDKLIKPKEKGPKVSPQINATGDRSREIYNYNETQNLAVEHVNNMSKPIRVGSTVLDISEPTHIPFVKVVPATDCQMESQTVLSQEDEKYLGKWVASLAKMGLNKTKKVIMDTVEAIIEKNIMLTPSLKDNLWFYWYTIFLNLYPDLNERKKIASERAFTSLNSVSNIIHDFIEEECSDPFLWLDPRRWFNANDLGFPISSKSNKVLASKKIPKNLNSYDTQITVQACMNAAGFFLKPLIVFPVQKISNEPLSGFPGASYGRTETGRIDSDTFVTWLQDVFSPSIDKKGITRPVVLFVNCHASHTSFAVSKFCQENQIILCCLLGYSNKARQPCDISLFRSLTEEWKQSVFNYKMANDGDIVTTSEFVKVFKPAWEKACTTEAAVKGFKKSNLFSVNVLKALMNDEKDFGQSQQSCVTEGYSILTRVRSGSIPLVSYKVGKAPTSGKQDSKSVKRKVELPKAIPNKALDSLEKTSDEVKRVKMDFVAL